MEADDVFKCNFSSGAGRFAEYNTDGYSNFTILQESVIQLSFGIKEWNNRTVTSEVVIGVCYRFTPNKYKTNPNVVP